MVDRAVLKDVIVIITIIELVLFPMFWACCSMWHISSVPRRNFDAPRGEIITSPPTLVSLDFLVDRRIEGRGANESLQEGVLCGRNRHRPSPLLLQRYRRIRGTSFLSLQLPCAVGPCRANLTTVSHRHKSRHLCVALPLRKDLIAKALRSVDPRSGGRHEQTTFSRSSRSDDNTDCLRRRRDSHQPSGRTAAAMASSTA
jgi:hypothetical protein